VLIPLQCVIQAQSKVDPRYQIPHPMHYLKKYAAMHALTLAMRRFVHDAIPILDVEKGVDIHVDVW
jgi:hypothetical protein